MLAQLDQRGLCIVQLDCHALLGFGVLFDQMKPIRLGRLLEIKRNAAPLDGQKIGHACCRLLGKTINDFLFGRRTRRESLVNCGPDVRF